MNGPGHQKCIEQVANGLDFKNHNNFQDLFVGKNDKCIL